MAGLLPTSFRDLVNQQRGALKDTTKGFVDMLGKEAPTRVVELSEILARGEHTRRNAIENILHGNNTGVGGRGA